MEFVLAVSPIIQDNIITIILFLSFLSAIFCFNIGNKITDNIFYRSIGYFCFIWVPFSVIFLVILLSFIYWQGINGLNHIFSNPVSGIKYLLISVAELMLLPIIISIIGFGIGRYKRNKPKSYLPEIPNDNPFDNIKRK